MSVDITLKHSSVAGKVPTPADLQPGELAINTNVAGPALYAKDSAGSVIKIAGAGSVSTPDASETVAGIAEIATTTEITTGTDDGRIVSPLKLKQALDALPPGTTVGAIAPATPESGQAWFDTTTNTLNIWDGAAWRTSQPAASEAVAGIAEIATQAEVTAGTDDATIVTPLKLATSQATTVVWTRTGTELSPKTAGDDVFTSGDVKVGGTTGTPNISLNADGSAEFAGNLVSDGYFRTDRFATKAGLGLELGGTEYAFGAYVDSTNPVATIGLDGSAAFAGGVSARYLYAVTPDGEWNSFINQGGATNKNTVINNGSADVITFNNDGSASFAGDVKIGGTLPSAPNISLNGTDGSAEFAGQLYVNSSDTDTLYVRNLSSSGNALRIATGASESGANDVFKVDSNGNLTKAGSASFAGDVQVAGDAISGTADGITLRDSGLINASRATGNNIFAGFTTGTITQTSSITSDGSATFAGTSTVQSGGRKF